MKEGYRLTASLIRRIPENARCFRDFYSFRTQGCLILRPDLSRRFLFSPPSGTSLSLSKGNVVEAPRRKKKDERLAISVRYAKETRSHPPLRSRLPPRLGPAHALRRNPQLHSALPAQRVDSFPQSHERWQFAASHCHHIDRDRAGTHRRRNIRHDYGIRARQIALIGKSSVAVFGCESGDSRHCDCAVAGDLARRWDSLESGHLRVDRVLPRAGEHDCGSPRCANRVIRLDEFSPCLARADFMESGSTRVPACVSRRLAHRRDSFGHRRDYGRTCRRGKWSRLFTATRRLPIRHADGLCRRLHLDRAGVDVVWDRENVGE